MDLAQVEPPFPVEIWERIFRFCSGRVLKALRLVCHHWNGIVSGCPALRQKLAIQFSNRMFIEGVVPTMLPTAVANARFKECYIQSVDGWWSECGRNLTRLILNSCRIDPAMMFRMLRGCSNLKEFSLSYVKCFVSSHSTKLLGDREEAVDFKLNAMEKISVLGVLYSKEDFEILDGFRQIFPRLKHFSLYNFWYEMDTTKLTQLLESAKRTLEFLDLSINGELLKRLSEIGPLQIKRAKYSIRCSLSDINLWTKFCRNQPSLQELELWSNDNTDKALLALVTNMPNLKLLATGIDRSSQTFPSFLSHLIKVENVTIRANHRNLDFGAPFSASLTKLTIIEACFVDGITFLMHSPHVQELCLIRCTLTKWSIPLTVPTFSTLKHLELTDCTIGQAQHDYVVRCHPRLESVKFSAMRSVRIGTIVALLLHSPKLQRVELVNCAHFAASTSGEQIMRHYHRKHGSPPGSRNVCFRFS